MLRNVNQQGHNSKYNSISGTYHPSNPEKFLGKYEPIYKSKLEAKMMFYLDHNENVVKWNYEAFPIKYIDIGRYLLINILSTVVFHREFGCVIT